MLQDELTHMCKERRIQHSYIPSDFRLVMELQELIEANFKQQRDPQFYATQLSVTLWVLNPLCRLHFGRTVYGLIIDRVVREARGLLLISLMSAKQIGFELGFADPSCFSRFFFRETGERPGSYRRNKGIFKRNFKSNPGGT